MYSNRQRRQATRSASGRRTIESWSHGTLEQDKLNCRPPSHSSVVQGGVWSERVAVACMDGAVHGRAPTPRQGATVNEQ